MPQLLLGIFLGALAFSALGVLLSAPATNTPSQVMMLSNLVRLPIIFVSGIFVPFSQMPTWGRALAPLSPLSYSADLVRVGLGEARYFALWLDAAALIAYSVAFCSWPIGYIRKPAVLPRSYCCCSVRRSRCS
ncbi:MAG: ABC transporter permease [Burkholderiales bacterium]